MVGVHCLTSLAQISACWCRTAQDARTGLSSAWGTGTLCPSESGML